ncbi:MAG: response regulator [Pseudomonadota bacterium]
MKITTVVVDDDEVDRYVVKRKLGRRDEFGKVLEARSGQQFIDQVDQGLLAGEPENPLVLMDINMPGLNGFETVSALQARVEDGTLPSTLVVMMFTSSSNPSDRARAESLPIVAGYVVKPLDDTDVAEILRLYEAR